MKRLVIIDGKSVFYRGYYAMRNLATKAGVPTAGVYGFAVIMMEIVKNLRPDKVVVAWDKAKTSVAKRVAIYPEYKAGRVKPGEDFYVQIPLLRELVEALNWEFMECDNYEADDIIGTLSRQADRENYLTYIVSSDLDMLQIVDENTRMYRIKKGFSELEEMDVAAVEEKYGVRQAQFLDLKALKGDASDNIPGVPGIGEKTAVKLLNEYGDLKEVYRAVEQGEIKGKIEEKLRLGKESAEMSLALAKIMFDAPVKLEEVRDFSFEKDRVLLVMKKLEFWSLIRKFGLEEKLERGEEKRELPEGMVVEWDVKKRLHEDRGVYEQILGGKKFWDLGQGAFLLDPLGRRAEGDRAEEYYRQIELFKDKDALYKVFTEFDLPLIPILYKMEKKGILIDGEYFKGLKAELEQRLWKNEQIIYTEVGRNFNLNSPQQLSEVLYGDLKLPTKGVKKKTRGYSTGAKELSKLRGLHPVVEKIVEYRELAKLLNTYVIPLMELADEEGRVHTTFTQNVTATGRLSSQNPNLQNIPVRTEEGKRIREGFVAGKGRVLVSADYAQFELRLAAVLAGDEKMIADFNKEIDIHTKTAAEVFGVEVMAVKLEQRRAAKVINFGVLYGMSAKGLAEATGMGIGEAKAFIEGYFKVRRPIREYLDKTLEQARREGYVETYYGRRRPTPDVKSANFLIRTAAERAAENMPIQGTEADLMKKAMILVDRELPEGAELILQIHDSLVVECPEERAEEVARILKEIMEGVAPELGVKLKVEVEVGKSLK